MKYFKLKFLLIFAALAMAIPPAWAGTVVDVINRDVTLSTLGSIGNSTWVNPFSVTLNSGAEYTIRSMGLNGLGTPALNWNANGYLYATKSGGKLKSVTVFGDATATKNVDIFASNTAYSEAPSGTAVKTLKLSDNGTTYEFEDDYTFIAIKGKASSTRPYSITIVWETSGDTPTNPWINVTPDPLNINDDGGVFTVSAANMPDDGLGVSVNSGSPSNAFSFSKTNDNTFNDQNNYFPLTGNANNKYDLESGTVQVNYTGHALSAAGVIKFESTPESTTADVNYLYDGDIYIVGNVNEYSWNEPVAGVQMTKKSDGTYSAEITANAGNDGYAYLYFTKEVGAANYDAQSGRFGPESNGLWTYASTLNGTYCNLDTQGNLNTIKMAPGNYIFTIDPANNKFKIEEVAGPKIYNKVTDASQLIASKKYILVYEAKPAFMGSIYEASTPYGLSITGPALDGSSVNIGQYGNIRELTLSGNATDGWNFHNGDGYLKWTAGNSLNVGEEIDQSTSWIVDKNDDGFILKNAADNTRILQYNTGSPRFACYTGTQKSAVLYVEDGVEPILPTVVAPTILPEEREFASSVEVSMTCATTGATIYYTVDGTDPTTSSTAYTAPFTLNATTTVKAIAVLGNETSQVVTATFTKTGIETITDAQALPTSGANANFTFVGNAVVTFHNGNHLFIRDGSGSGLIYGVNAETKKYENGDVLTPGWKAKNYVYQEYTPEFTNPSGVGSTVNNGPVAPEILTTLALTDVNKYAGFNNVTITRVDDVNYYFTVDRQEICLRRAYTELVEALEVGKVYNVEGVVAIFNETPQLNLTKVTLVKQDPELAFNPASVTVYEGVQDFPEPELTAPEGVTVQSYQSSNPDVVTVNNEGKVTIVGVGTAVITATTAENDYYLSGTVTYDVEIKAKEAAGLSFGVTEPVTATYGDGNNFVEPELTIPAGLTVTYTCEPETVATVDSATGEVTIIGAGTATVTATTEGDESHNGGSASYTINVAKANATLSFAKNSIEATYGGEVPANALTNEAGLTVTYESSNKNIATVDNEGKVTIVKAGEVTITATGAANDNYNEATARYTLTIAKAEATLSFAPNAFTIVEGQEFTAPTLTNEAGLAVTYSSTNDAVATVDTNSGEVTIVGVGSTTITATGAENDNYKGATATYTITVEAKPVVATPTFTPAAGYYNSAQNVTIACETAGADIYYTTDGTVPTTESTKFAEAITVGENLTIKAIAVKEGYTNSDIAEAEYVIDIPVQIAALTFMPGSGHYTEAKEVSIACATPGVTITYKIGDGEFQPYTKPFVVDHSCTVTAKATKDGRAVWTDSEASATYTINKLNPLGITDGYYQIKNNGNNKYANVQGRKTMTFTNDIDQQAGTVIRVQTKDNGQVQVLRSQAADLQGYADRAMRYVPEVVQMIANKLHAEGTGEILGNDGLDAIMEKFNESFDYHLYVEGDLNNARIYGKTPSMQPVVDFYNENQAKVDAKLPMLEDFINDAIQKVLNKTNNHGASILVPFSVDTIWNRMGGTLIRPIDAESTMAFYHQVLTNKQYVWDFAYQTATFYLEKVKAHPKYQEMQNEFGEYTQYIDKLEQIRPDMKYFIVQNNGKVDYISEGNVDIINNAPRTYWNVEPRSEFSVNFPTANEYGGNYVTTLYTDFAYDVPETITAYKVSEVNENGNAVLTALKGTIPAQAPVLLVADSVGVYTLTLNIAPSALADMTGNQLHGPDYLINKYKINTPEVESVFNFAKETFGQTFYDNYVAQYEHLMLKSAGTVNNRYFWGLTDDDLTQCTYVNENNENDCVTRTLSMEDQQLGFYSNWEAKTNQAFLVSEQFNPIKLSLLRDVNRDGKVSIADVAAQIDILLALPEKPYLDRYDYDAADFNEDGTIKIDDVAGLISYLLSH